MKSYINYVKRQNKHVQDIHAMFFGGLVTVILTSIWLQYEYGIFYPQYKRLPDATTIRASNSTSTKIQNIDDLWSSFGQILNNTKNIVNTYQKASSTSLNKNN